ncbi:MAG: hypothetical protein ACLFUU_05920 [Desulfobacteraceae bacterium]
MTWDEALAAYRSAMTPEIVNFMIDMPWLINLAVAWQNADKQLEPPGDDLSLPALWQKVKIDYRQLERMTGLDFIQVTKGMNILKDNRMVFPDGSLNRFAGGYIRGRVKAMLKPKPEKPENIK